MRVLALLLSAALAVAPLHAAAKRRIVSPHVPPPPYGVFADVDPNADPTTIGRGFDLAASDGIQWLRVQLTWSAIQPNAQSADYRFFSGLLFRATQDKLNVVGILCCSTPWNTTAPASEKRAAQREHYPPADYDAWARFVTLTVTTYKDRVHYWEIWNQPDLGLPADPTQPCNGFWCGTSQDYARLLAVSHKAIKDADPNAIIVLGGLSFSPEANRDFLLQVLTDPDNPGPDNFEIINFRVSGSKSDVLNRVNFVKSQMFYSGAGLRKLWVEFGYPSDPALQTVAPYFGGESGQAAYATDIGPYLVSLGVERLFWIQLFDTNDPFPSYGLLTAAMAKKQAYDAYGALITSFRP